MSFSLPAVPEVHAAHELAHQVRMNMSENVGGRLTHHNASAQVFDADAAGRSRVVWIADLLHTQLAPVISGMIEQGLLAMKRTLEQAAARSM